jgi:hypothetical protein
VFLPRQASANVMAEKARKYNGQERFELNFLPQKFFRSVENLSGMTDHRMDSGLPETCCREPDRQQVSRRQLLFSGL